MYYGMLVDTDNFVNKTGVRTFEAAAYLKRNGADLTKVRKMSRESMEGVVEEIASNAFKVKLTNGMDIRATLAGKLRIHHIRILPGDKVKVEISPYDLTNGRIVYRNK